MHEIYSSFPLKSLRGAEGQEWRNTRITVFSLNWDQQPLILPEKNGGQIERESENKKGRKTMKKKSSTPSS